MAGAQNTPTPAADPAASDAPPVLQGAKQSAQNPIGVPYYITDPSTGQPMTGPDGNPLRWGASVPVDPNAHGSYGTQGPGTRPSGGYDPVSQSQYTLPRYFNGDEWLPAQLPPDKLASLQKKMVDAGLLKPGEAQLGIWDVNSMNAYQKLLAYANASGLDAATALDRWGAQHAANPSSGGPSQPLVVKVTNPDDLRQTFRKAVIDTLGQGWDQGKIDQMVNAYQQVETQAQQQQYQMTGSGSPTDPGAGGTLTAPPAPDTFAATQARQENPELAQEHDALGFINQFQQMVGQWQKVN